MSEPIKSDFHIVLYEPMIPQNTGAIARLCACTGASLHLIHPLGFDVSEKAVRRAGLDYWKHVAIKEHADWNAFLANEDPQHLFLFSKFAKQSVYETEIRTPSYMVFGSETNGLPERIRQEFESRLFKIPMRTQVVRSLNLAQCASAILFEAQRQNPPEHFKELQGCLEEPRSKKPELSLHSPQL